MKASLLLVCFLFLIFGSACNTYQNGFTQYTIDQNQHYCNGWRLGLTRTPYRQFEFVFDSTCVYDEKLTGKAWSKVGGFTTGHTHWNSVRVGWQSENGKISLGYYCYVGRKRIAGKMTETVPGQINQAELFWNKPTREYVIRINGIEERVAQPRNKRLYVYTYPFLGGRFKAPTGMHILVRNLNPQAQPIFSKRFSKRSQGLSNS
jgi:hypothetical protein